MPTMQSLIQRTIVRLSMVNGVNTQIYAEERIGEMIYHKFLLVRDTMWWDDLMEYHALTVGADGTPTENVVRELPLAPLGDEIVINRYSDIEHIWLRGRDKPLSEYPTRRNIMNDTHTGTPYFRRAHSDKVLQVLPYQVGAQIVVRHKKYYPMFNPSDIVPMDDQLMILGAAYDYLEDDGGNPGQTEKFFNMFNARLDQLKVLENSKEIHVTSGYSNTTDRSGYQVV